MNNIKETTNMNEIIKKVEGLNKEQHIYILEIIIKKEKNKVSENKNGCFVNLQELSQQTLEEITNYIKYIELKNEDIDKVEKIKYNMINNISSNSL